MNQATMQNLSPAEEKRFKEFTEELSLVGQRQELSKERLIQGFLYFGVKLADEFDVEYEIDGTEVTVSE